MRQLLRELAASVTLLAGVTAQASAQQGSLQISGSAQSTLGNSFRIGDQPRFEPDAGVSWFQPSSRFGAFQMEMRGTRRGREPHLGKAWAAWRGVKIRGGTWTFEVGDIHFTPPVGDYRFTNLSTPAITLLGGAVSARTARSSASIVVGRTTAWRNIFGTDADTLGQELALARAAHKPLAWLEITARASRIRTNNLKEFTYTIAASDQAGGGVHVTLGPALQLAADAGIVSYKRAGSREQVRDGSAMAGASLTLARGWVQINASRFSPGEFPLLNYPLVDRRTAFAAGEYDLSSRMRVFGGWEDFRSNLDPARSSISRTPQPETTGTRGFAGVRVLLGARSGVSVRLEDGDRRTRPSPTGRLLQSDTGVFSAELQSTFARVTGFVRVSRRENVETPNVDSGYTQNDAAAQLFVHVSRAVQLFATGAATKNEVTGGGSIYYQLGGGGQIQMLGRGLSLRAEGTATRNLDMFSQTLVARESFNIGINGQVARNTTVGLNIFSDRAPPGAADLTPWVTRSTLRVTRSFATGSVRVASPAGSPAAAVTRARGTGSVVGSVFADWNANGAPDPDEGPLEGIPVLLAAAGSATTSSRGEFSFVNVPVGLQRVELDVSALPVDYDPPNVASVQIELARGDTRSVMFGLVPLGTVTGRVARDANANGKLDADDEPVDGAVLVLDAGARSERARKGRFRFDAVRSGDHTLDLLLESLPEGAAIVGERSVKLSLTKDRLTTGADFLITVEKRPEIRKVFPPRGGGAPSAGSRPAPPGTAKPSTPTPTPARPAAAPRSRPAPGTAAPSSSRAATTLRASGFAIQVAALSDPARARALVQELKAAGFPAFVVEPGAADPQAPYRIRVGPYATRAAVDKALAALEQKRGEKLWVITGR
jgi:cell division septation protein DedD